MDVILKLLFIVSLEKLISSPVPRNVNIARWAPDDQTNDWFRSSISLQSNSVESIVCKNMDVGE